VSRQAVVTPEGLEKLKEEIEFLSTTKRREVAARIKEAREFGDISENAEYDDAKNEQALLETRIAQLEERLRRTTVIDEDSISSDEVGFGSIVHVKDQKSGDSQKFQIVGSTEAEAKTKLAELGALTDPVYAMKVLSERVGHDLSSYPLDGPVPELPPSTIMQGHAITLAETARRRKMTVRELRDLVGISMGHKLMCGTPEQIVDEMTEWFDAGAGDGFNLLPAWFPGGFDAFVDHVVPVLQKRGLLRTEYTGHTLREHLGLSRPEHPQPSRAASRAISSE